MSLSRKLAGARLKNGPEAGGGHSDNGRSTPIPPSPPAAASKSNAPAPPPPPRLPAAASKRKAALQLPGSSQTEYAVIPRKRPPGRCDHDLMTERQKEVRPPAADTVMPFCIPPPHPAPLLLNSCKDPQSTKEASTSFRLTSPLSHRATPDAFYPIFVQYQGVGAAEEGSSTRGHHFPHLPGPRDPGGE